MNLLAGSQEFVHEALGFSGVTPADANGISAAGESTGDGRAYGIARAHQYSYAATFGHS
jgi:hypothetical protein